MPRIRVSAPGKIILSGEHAVVHGKPALVAAVDHRLEATAEWKTDNAIFARRAFESLSHTGAAALLQNLQAQRIVTSIRSDIPIGSGMGSSAALAVALSALLHRMTEKTTSLDAINDSAYEMEKFAHGTPSGIDNTVITFGGLLHFQRTENGSGKKRFVRTLEQLHFLVVHTGQPIETTKEMVQLVQDRLKRHPNDQAIIDEIGGITKQIELLIVSGRNNDSLSLAIAENEQLLEKLGVVSASTQRLIRKIESFGGVAKISGAGGISGASGIVLVLHSDPDWLEKKLSQLDIKTLPATISPTGLTIEEQ